MTTATRKNPALERLHAGVTEIANQESWQAALRFRRQFHRYSFNNVLLIYFQRPDATLVAGYRKWQELGRQVRKGERGMKILAPLARRDDDGEQRVYGFRSVSVFDVSQTDGDELPDTPDLEWIDCDAPEAVARLEGATHALGVRFETGAIEGTALGTYNPADHSIRVRDDLPAGQRAKTLAHELAHAILHRDVASADRETAELEAESAAFLVMDAFGVDASGYAFGYLAGWGGDDPEALLAAGQVASRAADAILERCASLELGVAA